jgi:hypothetical protein
MPNTLLLPEIDVAELGPAMAALTPLQRGFVLAKVYLGLNDVEAARAAGYAPSTAKDQAYLIAHNEGVQAAILDASKALLRGGEGARSLRVMIALRDDRTVKADTRLRAAEMIANRAGLHTTTEHHLEVRHHLSEAEMDRRILALAAELGMGPDEAQKMLIAPAEMQCNAAGVFELAEPPHDPTPAALSMRELRRRRTGMTPEEIAADKARVPVERSDRLKREYAAATDVEAEEPHEGATSREPEPELW